MEQIMCLCLFASAACAAFSLLGVLAAVVPERVYDFILERFFGIKKAADPQRDSQKT